jgi:hypothetical protein
MAWSFLGFPEFCSRLPIKAHLDDVRPLSQHSVLISVILVFPELFRIDVFFMLIFELFFVVGERAFPEL